MQKFFYNSYEFFFIIYSYSILQPKCLFCSFVIAVGQEHDGKKICHGLIDEMKIIGNIHQNYLFWRRHSQHWEEKF